MTSRERLLAAMNGEVPDRVPKDISWGLSPIFYQKFKEKTKSEDFMEYFDVDYRFLNIKKSLIKTDYSGYYEGRVKDKSFHMDEWGVGYEKGRNTDLHFEHIISPLKFANKINEIIDYKLPDFNASYRTNCLKEDVKALHEKGLAAAAPLTQTIFEISWMLRGFDDLMMDMLENDEMAECIFDKVTDLRIKTAEIYAESNADVLMLGDDVAMQTGMLISPAIWKKWLKPRMEKIICTAKNIKPDIKIFYHSDGNPEVIIKELIEMGIDILNPIQPECMDPAEIKRKYGKKIALWGTIGIQTNLPFGSTEDVRNEVKLRMETVGRDGGFIIGPSHVIEPEVPWENLIAMYEAIEEYGRYF